MGLYTPEGMITIAVTSRCNIDCIYCYTNKENNTDQTLDIEFAKVGIADFFRQSKSRRLRLYGSGEPTTEFELLKQIISYARQISPEPLQPEIQTNGVFTEQVASWISENMSIIYISSDGFPDVQNYFRPTIGGKGTSVVVEKNIRHFVAHSKAMIAIRAGIGRSNIDKQKNIIQYFADLGIKYIWTRPIFIPPIVKKDIKHEVIDLVEYTHKFIEAYHFAKELGVFYGSFLSCNFDSPTKYYCNASRPSPLLTTDGYVSACDHVMFGKTAGEYSLFVYGKWNDKKRVIEYDTEKIRNLQIRTVDNIDGCRGCKVQQYCGGYCMSEALKASGNIYGKKPGVCDATRLLFANIPTGIERYACQYP